MAINTEQVSKMMLDTGAVFVGGVLLSPCEGDNAFVVTREYRDIPYNGAPGKTKGLKRVLTENATLTVHPKGLTQSVLKMALPGIVDEAGVLSGGGRKAVADEDYVDEVMFVGDMKDGTTKVFTIFNCLSENGLTITASENSEAILELVFSAHYNPEDLNEPIYTISDGDVIGTSEVTFAVSTSGSADADLATVNFAGRSINPTSGDAVFTSVAYGANRPYTILLEGHDTVYGSVTVDSASEAIPVVLQEQI